MAPLHYAAKFDPFLSLDCARVEGMGAQSNERKGSNFAILQPYPQDEQYVEWIRRATPNAGVIHVIDTRPHMNAMANKAGGKGYESEKFYNNIVFSFKGIENIHKMRASLRMLTSTVSATASVDGFMSELNNSGWLKHVKAVLDSSVAIMQGVSAGRSVIVHCSDGWDRTAQTCSLAELMLDGYYRTVTGFQALVEKDWLAFGHKFMDRCGHVDGDPNEVSPTFPQFLDCVWQLTQLYPQAFQFNEKYLLTIHEHVYRLVVMYKSTTLHNMI